MGVLGGRAPWGLCSLTPGETLALQSRIRARFPSLKHQGTSSLSPDLQETDRPESSLLDRKGHLRAQGQGLPDLNPPVLHSPQPRKSQMLNRTGSPPLTSHLLSLQQELPGGFSPLCSSLPGYIDPSLTPGSTPGFLSGQRSGN